MDRFYPDIESLDAFTRSLAGLGEKIQCNHCQQYGQMVSHGFIYNQHASAEKEPVGKRVFCSNRHGRSGDITKTPSAPSKIGKRSEVKVL